MPRWPMPLRVLADLLLPRACPGCDRPLSGHDEPFCPACTQRLLADVGRDYCPRCGAPAEPYLTTAEGCPDCRDYHGPLEGIVRVGTYRGVSGDIIKRFKYKGQQRLDRTLGLLLADAMRSRPWCGELDALVPVPTNWRGWWMYGFHPAGLIARCASRSLRLPLRPLVRVHHKRQLQKGLSETERFLNIRGAFRMARRRARVEGACLCIIDDVSTTGATLREMARVLKAAGAAHVFGAVVAKTQIGGDDQAAGGPES